MISHTTKSFRRAFRRLPKHVQRQARDAYKLFMQNPYHNSLHFQRIHPTEPVYSVRIGLDYRALGDRDEDEVTWFWIGSHEEYDKLISQL
jgi:mRNA-degrading endonuclease RelE of RelBE toxin-antitoxin system